MLSGIGIEPIISRKHQHFRILLQRLTVKYGLENDPIAEYISNSNYYIRILMEIHTGNNNMDKDIERLIYILFPPEIYEDKINDQKQNRQ